jgi:hypothetical protein
MTGACDDHLGLVDYVEIHHVLVGSCAWYAFIAFVGKEQLSLTPPCVHHAAVSSYKNTASKGHPVPAPDQPGWLCLGEMQPVNP